MDNRRQRLAGQSGLVSLVIVSIIAVLLALIVVGFATLMNRDLRQSLDNDLSTQAYYAAESGLNDARSFINALKYDPSLASAVTSPNTCLNTSDARLSPYFSPDGNISGNNVVKYTCVLLQLTPPELVYDISTGQTVVFQAGQQSGNPNIRNLYFSWENTYYTDPSAKKPLTNNCCALPQENTIDPNATGMLKVTVYTAQPPYNSTDNQLASGSGTFYLYPNAGSGNLGSGNFSSNGSFINGNCNTSHPANLLPYGSGAVRYCNAEITNIPASAKVVYVAISSIYRDTTVSVQGSVPSGGSLNFSGAEASADVTGEGNDVLQRVKAHIPYKSNFSYPSAALDSMQTVCKRFRVPKTGPNTWGDAFTEPNLPPNGNDSNCQI